MFSSASKFQQTALKHALQLAKCMLSEIPDNFCQQTNDKMDQTPMSGDDQQISQTNELLNSIKDLSVSCIMASKNLLRSLQTQELEVSDGLSILKLKNEMFISYMLDIIDWIENKLLGQRKDDNLNRLIEARVVLERIKNIEDKIKYQIDMLLQNLNNTGTIRSEENPLNYKPDFSFALENLAQDQTEDSVVDVPESTEESVKTNDSKQTGVYVAPRLAPMKYDEYTEEERKAKNLERLKKRAINSSLINELRKEFDDAPEEEHDGSMGNAAGIGKFLKKKKKFEEDYFVRLNLTKKQKAQAKKLSTVNSIGDDVTRFEDISILNDEHYDENDRSTNKSSKFKRSKMVKRKKGKKFKRH